ncbi:MAG: Beta-monoglucosyldiacylglycerol synthase [Chthoniobacteraceae bacterium]|nr:Beta-monoglucosyldiacylglycerol synthase [Chthoniobacteraceae bacterium]
MQEGLGNTIWTFCYFVVLFGLSLYGLHRYVIVYLFLKNRKNPPKPLAQFTELPFVTVQLPIFNELYVVERLLKSVAELEYPKDRLQVQVLDDSTDETTAIAAARVVELKALGLDIELIHRTDRTGFKAGALENGLKSCKGEFILILDADFVPTSDMVLKTIHYFTDPVVGMIQTRWGHLNRTYSILTRVQAMFLDGHLLLEQTARSRSGRFFNFNGTAGLWRRSCIADAGGWQHDTLTEDLDLSYRAQLKGWKFVFMADLVTPAELPVDMNGFKSQQHRWTKGSIQTCMKLLPSVWRAELPLLIKLEATAHLTSNYAYLLLFFLCILLHPSAGGGTHSFWRTFLVDIPIFVSASLPAAVFYICTQRELHPKTWIRDLLLLPALIGLGIGLAINNSRAVIEAMLGHQSEFTRTPKYGIHSTSQSWKRSQYSPLKSMLPFVEFGFAAYFSYFLFFAICQQQWLSIPFLMLFAGGFGYVALCSIAQWFPQLRNPWRAAEAPLPL